MYEFFVNLDEAKFWSDLISQAIAGIIGATAGALIGATVAFRLERSKAKEDRQIQATKDAAEMRARRAAAGNLAMFTLTRIQNDLVSYNGQFLVPGLAKPAPWLMLPPTNFETAETHRFDIGSLAFLLQSGTPEMLLKLALEEDRFHSLVDLIRIRSAFHEAHFPAEMEIVRTKYNNPEILSENILRETVTPVFYFTLRNYTTDIKTLVDLGIVSSKTVADELRALLVKELPGEKIIGFTVVEEVARRGSPVMAARNATN